MHGTADEAQTSVTADKRAYARPQLLVFGLVSESTAGGSRSGIENDPFGCENSTVGEMGTCKP